jgi:hypothetical protein
MLLRPITYEGRLVAVCTRSRFYLVEELELRPTTDPERTFVVFMCAYACAVLRDELPGPFSHQAARYYARAALIPDEVLERDHLDAARAAAALRVPAAELRAARAEQLSQRRLDDRFRRSPS